MAGIQGRAAGFIATLYYSDDVIDTKSITNVSAACTSNTEIIDTSDMGALSKARTIIDIPVYGKDVMSKLPGQADPGTFDFTVSYNHDDVIHAELRDDDGKTPHTFIVKFTQGSNESYAAFDGYVATADVTFAIDDRITLSVSVARDGDVTYVNKA